MERTRLPFRVAFALVIGALAAEHCHGQLLTNAGLEDGEQGWQKKVPFQAKVLFGERELVRLGRRAVRIVTHRSGSPGQVWQVVPKLSSGVYELTVWARGVGESKLRLEADGIGARALLADPENWQQYSLVFETAEDGPATVRLSTVIGNVVFDDVRLAPADDALRAAWSRQQEALAQFFFVPSGYSAQRAPPYAGGAVAAETAEVVPITDKTVLYDPRYDGAWNTNVDQIAAWFERRGFVVRDVPAVVDWMETRIRKRTAYGSVVVNALGLIPMASITPRDETCLLRRYLDAGGRMVWTGDTVLYVAQAETGPRRSVQAMGPVLGLTEDRSVWSREPAGLTTVGKAWGLEGVGSGIRAQRAAEVSLVLSGNRQLRSAAIWLKTTNPAYPLSGMVASVHVLDGKHEAALRDFYRMALFTGQPVTVPNVPAPDREAAVVATIRSTAGGAERRVVVRGETVEVTVELTAPAGVSGAVEGILNVYDRAPRMRHYDLADSGVAESEAVLAQFTAQRATQDPIATTRMPIALTAGKTTQSAAFTLTTKDLAVGDYEISATISGPALPSPLTAQQALAICPARRTDRVVFAMRGGVPDNPYRLYAYLDELKTLGHDLQIGEHHLPLKWDAILRNGQAFIAGVNTPSSLIENIKDVNGKDVPNPWAGGRAGLKGLAGEHTRENVRKQTEAIARRLAPFPGFMRNFLVNDDFSARGGLDWNEHNVRTFKQKTGLDAPRPKGKRGFPEKQNWPTGVYPDNDPWLQWQLFLTYDVLGAFNDAQRRGYEAGCPGAWVWPVPGGAQWPLFGLLRGGQYPPANFGADRGLNLLGYYAYLGYWCPSLHYVYWNEVARMENRDLDLFIMPDAGGDARHYVRNVAHLLLASGADGIVYFVYSWLKDRGKEEHAELGHMLARHGALLKRLRPAPREVGLLLPVSDAVYNTSLPLRQGYVFHNLMLTHINAETISEGEIADRRNRLILLSDVQRLRASAANALAEHIERGGIVAMDKTCAVPIPGAGKLDFRLAIPTLAEYNNPKTLAALRAALHPLARPRWTSPDPCTIVRTHLAPDGTTYVYAVEVDTQQEYLSYRRNVYEPATFKKKPPLPPDEIDAFLKEHGMREHVKETTLTVAFDTTELPEGGQIVDVYRGETLSTRKLDDGRLAVSARTRRFGGVLLAVLPKPIAGVAITAPAVMRPGQTVETSVTVTDVAGQLVPGLQSIQLTLRSPAGETEREVSGHYCAEGGRLTVSFVPAKNHPRGRWTLEAVELLTGRRATAVLRLLE